MSEERQTQPAGSRRHAVVWLSVVLLQVGSSGFLSAQERPIPLDTLLVEVNSRASPALGSSTRAVDVIDAEALRAGPATTLTDALRWAFGVELMPRSPALVDVAIRGSSFEQVLVLVDGVRMRDGQTGHFNLNLAVPLDQVERIEVLRGPAASLYGSDAMAGVINIVTRRAGNQTMASIAAGSFGTLTATAAHQQQVAGVQVDLGASHQRSDGHRPGTDYEMGTGRIQVGVPLAGSPIWAEIAFAARDFGAAGFYGPYPSFEATRATTASARWLVQASPGATLEPLVRYRRHTDDFILVRDNPALYRNRHATTQLGSDLIGRFQLSNAVRAAAGLHANHDEIESAALGDRAEWTVAGSLELAAGQPGRGTGTLGLRADRLVTGESAISPGASAAWWLIPSVRLRASAGRAFRSPTWTERYYRDPQHIGNAELSPERAWSADAGVDAYPWSGFRVGASGFVRDARDLIDWARPSSESAVPWHTRNVERAEFRGVELEGELERFLGARLRARGAWTSMSSSAAAGYTSKYALRPQVESILLSAERSLWGPLHLAVKGARERRLGEKSHMLLDLRAAVQFSRGRLWADLYNTLDEGYLDISQQPAPRRAGMLGLEWRLER